MLSELEAAVDLEGPRKSSGTEESPAVAVGLSGLLLLGDPGLTLLSTMLEVGVADTKSVQVDDGRGPRLPTVQEHTLPVTVVGMNWEAPATAGGGCLSHSCNL